MLQRVLLLAVTTAILAAPLAAQTVPQGLKVRVDRSTDASDPDDTPELKVVTMGKGFRVTGGPAGVFWNPTQTASGNYTLKGTFNLQQPSNHTNYYGLVFGGADLEGPKQTYTYFVVAQNGQFQIRHRNGEMVTTVHNRTANPAIRQPGADGKSTNVLEVRVSGDTISYVVNGQVVHAMAKGTTKIDGLVGARVNHMMDVQIEGLELQKQ